MVTTQLGWVGLAGTRVALPLPPFSLLSRGGKEREVVRAATRERNREIRADETDGSGAAVSVRCSVSPSYVARHPVTPFVRLFSAAFSETTVEWLVLPYFFEGCYPMGYRGNNTLTG